MLDQLQNSGIAVLNERPAPKQNTIIIIGVPRSGTTMVAKVLANLGVYLGAEVDDSVGEDMRLARALEANDGSLPAVIEVYNSLHDLWAFKRPTAYQVIDPALFRNPRFVVTFRDPVAIARREEVSMMFDFREQLRRAVQWSADLAGFALSLTAPVMLVSYEKALVMPIDFVTNLASFAGIPADNDIIRETANLVAPSPSDYVSRSQIRFQRT